MYADLDMRQIRFHQYRIQVIEMWPEGLEKQASLSAARAAFLREAVYETDKSALRQTEPASEDCPDF